MFRTMKSSPLTAALCAAAVASAASASVQQHRYCIVGAGPGGLQMSHYLNSVGRDFVVLEKVLCSVCPCGSVVEALFLTSDI